MQQSRIILASSSSYRKHLLERLLLPFESVSPAIDETPLATETPAQTAERLALMKARALKDNFPNAFIIGSDQTAACKQRLLGKPGCERAAIEQLSDCSGKVVTFYTGLCLYDSARDQYQIDTVSYQVKFLPLSASQITSYIKKEQPLDCAGSFKAEALGSALFESQTGSDPTALIGLPLIRLCAMLRQVGIEPLS